MIHPLILSWGIGGACYLLPKGIEKAFPLRPDDNQVSGLRYNVRDYIEKFKNIHPVVKHYAEETISKNLWLGASIVTYFVAEKKFNVLNTNGLLITVFAINGACILLERTKSFISKDIPKMISYFST